jgi:hypothetical protein
MDTLVSGDESFNTPTIISFVNCGEVSKKSIDDAKVLLYLDVGIYANDANEKEIYGECYLRMVLNFSPCGFHFFTPVNIVEYKNSC